MGGNGIESRITNSTQVTKAWPDRRHCVELSRATGRDSRVSRFAASVTSIFGKYRIDVETSSAASWDSVFRQTPWKFQSLCMCKCLSALRDHLEGFNNKSKNPRGVSGNIGGIGESSLTNPALLNLPYFEHLSI